MREPIRPSRRDVLALAAGTLACAALPARAQAPALLRGARATQSLEGAAFGTTWRITLPADARTEGLHRRIADRLAGIDRLMSPWRADSEISRFNAAPAGAHPVSAETARVADAALGVADSSGGAFDPSVGPLVARWGFGPIAGQAGSWRGLSAGERTVSKEADGLTLDLCGIAKGWALDRMADLIEEAGHANVLADLGGELLARGRHPSGRPWQVGVEDPQADAIGLRGVLALDRAAVATSGWRFNGYVLGERRYSHIIDPVSHAPVAGRLAAVSVVAATAMEADAWATALMASGAAGPDRARAQGLPALFLFAEGAGLRRVTTRGIDAMLG